MSLAGYGEFVSEYDLPEVVQLHNDMNAYVNEMQQKLSSVFRDLVRTTVCKADNSLTAKCRHLLPELLYGPTIRVVHEPDPQKLLFLVTMMTPRTENDRRPIRYLTHRIEVGELEVGFLKRIQMSWPLPKYDLETVRALRCRAREAAVFLKLAREACGPFLEF